MNLQLPFGFRVLFYYEPLYPSFRWPKVWLLRNGCISGVRWIVALDWLKWAVEVWWQ